MSGDSLHIYVDADACPVKNEIYRVAERYELHVTLVSARPMWIPSAPNLSLEVVDQGFDAADDWIVAHAGRDDIVVTADIPLAARCLEHGAYALGPTGRPFTESNIGDVLATNWVSSSRRSWKSISTAVIARTSALTAVDSPVTSSQLIVIQISLRAGSVG